MTSAQFVWNLRLRSGTHHATFRSSASPAGGARSRMMQTLRGDGPQASPINQFFRHADGRPHCCGTVAIWRFRPEPAVTIYFSTYFAGMLSSKQLVDLSSWAYWPHCPAAIARAVSRFRHRCRARFGKQQPRRRCPLLRDLRLCRRPSRYRLLITLLLGHSFHGQTARPGCCSPFFLHRARYLQLTRLRHRGADHVSHR